ncbi:hypothetical protein CNMCM6936_002427 [Aspergillus lentulus]|nr:hypothetical protein CNMCM6936_002427 [Aspergillus lentulus]KAF4176754.1 hypothetical protein CNMCM8060_006031 [Aspergillus lentulus]KAF4185047.1 hypothetical protein CNMCM7927_007185 [Aspergillus lentulus]KAF4195655.1 hypothetical protein CNMCM8694_005928 [Aspergillus lentulus]
MADLRYRKEDRVDMIHRTYSCRISRFLDAHGIPNVLWGEHVMNMFLIPVVTDVSSPVFLRHHKLQADELTTRQQLQQGIYFIIPDEHIDKARDLLVEADFPPCQLGKYCGFDWPKSCHGIPYAHFNIVDRGPMNYYKPELYGPNPREWYTLELYKKSEMLWGAPEIPLGPPAQNDPDYWTINDERLPEVHRGFCLGRVVEADYPVKIPSPARYTESLTLLYFRDNYPEDTFRGSYWDYLLLDMHEVLQKHRLFTLRDLPPRTRSWFKILTENIHERTHGDAEERFGEEMKKSGEVPEKSPWPSEHRMPPGWREDLKRLDEEEEERRKKKEEEEEQTRKNEEEVKEEQNA